MAGTQEGPQHRLPLPAYPWQDLALYFLYFSASLAQRPALSRCFLDRTKSIQENA